MCGTFSLAPSNLKPHTQVIRAFAVRRFEKVPNSSSSSSSSSYQIIMASDASDALAGPLSLFRAHKNMNSFALACLI
jgi:hypothetical protein